MLQDAKEASDPAQSETLMVLWCSEDTVSEALDRFVAEKGRSRFAQVCIFGGAKPVVRPENEADQDFVSRQIRALIKFCNAKHLVLMLHVGCVAYRGLNLFNEDDPGAEAEYLANQLRRAKAILQTRLPIPIEAVLLSSDGIYEIA